MTAKPIIAQLSGRISDMPALRFKPFTLSVEVRLADLVVNHFSSPLYDGNYRLLTHLRDLLDRLPQVVDVCLDPLVESEDNVLRRLLRKLAAFVDPQVGPETKPLLHDVASTSEVSVDQEPRPRFTRFPVSLLRKGVEGDLISRLVEQPELLRVEEEERLIVLQDISLPVTFAVSSLLKLLESAAVLNNNPSSLHPRFKGGHLRLCRTGNGCFHAHFVGESIRTDFKV